MRVAGIDCGTNSIRLLIAEANNGKVKDIVREMEIVRLGQGVDKTGRFDAHAIERTFDASERFAALCREHDVASIRFAATSATRDAANRDVFLEGILERLGVPVQVLSGEEEARTSFEGAASVLPASTSGSILAIDLGGGSTELVLGDHNTGVQAAFSMNVGSVRMRERHLHSDPPTSSEVEAARADVRAALDEAEKYIPLGKAREVVGLAGTVTSVTAKYLGLTEYDSSRVHGTRMSVADITHTAQWFVTSPVEQIRALGFMHPGRADVIGAGALVWQEVVARIAARMRDAGSQLDAVITSEHDILDGLALWAEREPQRPAWR